MLINWFTVAAQIVNFLILVALLKRFLYAPIIQAMNEREARIAAQLADADHKRQEAKEEEASLRQKISEIEGKRQEMLAEAVGEVEAQKRELLAKTRQEVDVFRQSWIEALKREEDAFSQDVRQRLGQQVFGIARLVLKELGNSDLEQRLIGVFLERLATLNQEERQAISESLREPAGEMVISSAFEIPEESRARILAAVREQFGKDITCRFETSAALLGGIELKTRDRKIGWSMEHLLETLDANLSEIFATSRETAGT